jgi:tetratricopeptide (TPR) repeat protein
MKKSPVSLLYAMVLSVSLISFAPFFSSEKSIFSVYAQFGNSISGHVFGLQRQPLSDVSIELLDDFSPTISRTRTDASGRYSFSRISSGRFRVRILPYGLDYEEQEQEIEIQNFTRDGITTGFDNVQRDFYLKQRKGTQPNTKSESLFVQEIPPQAKETYKKAINLINGKKEEQGLKELKSSIELFPQYFEALERLGLEYIKLKHFEAAHILLNKAVEINPRAYKSWYGLAYSLYSLNAIDQALKAAEKANSLDQFSVESKLLTGVLLRQAKRYEEAEKDLKKAKELSKGSVAEVHWHLALLYGNNLKRYREAADELELFLKARPDSKDAEDNEIFSRQSRDVSNRNFIFP